MKVFVEIQRMPKWIYFIMGLGLVMPVALLLWTFSRSASEAEKNETLIALVIVICTEALAFWFISAMKQYVRIDKEGVHYKYPPFKTKEVLIPMNHIDSYKIQDYNVPNYGYKVGKWNILNHTPSITTMGLEKVIRINYHEGKTILIGTKRPEEIMRILHNFKSKNDDIF